MESFVSKYLVLFKVNILHHHYLDAGKLSGGIVTYKLFDDLTTQEKGIQLQKYKIDSWLEIAPTRATERILNKKGLIFKKSNEGFAVYTSVVSKKPGKKLGSTRFAFDLFFQNEGAAVSALPRVRDTATNVPVYYLYSNEVAALSGNTAGSLCQSPPAYSTTRKYVAGEIVAQAGKHYISLDNSDNKNKAVTNTSYWTEIEDTIRFSNTSNLRETPSLMSGASGTEIINFTENALPATAFGRIEIMEDSYLPADFRVLNASDEVQEKQFDIRIHRM